MVGYLPVPEQVLSAVTGFWLGQLLGYRYREDRYRSAGFRPRATVPRRSVRHEFPSWSFHSRCGVQRGRIFWSGWPLDGVTLDVRWLEIRPVLRRSIWISRNEVVAVHIVRLPLSQVLVFRAASGDFDGVAVAAVGNPSHLLRALARFGWPVPPSPPGGIAILPASLPPPPTPPPLDCA